MLKGLAKLGHARLASAFMLFSTFILAAACAAALLAYLSNNQVAANPQDFLRVGVDVNLKPFVYQAPNGELLGIDVAVAEEVCRDVGRPCKFVAMEWDGLILALNVGKIDVVISSMSITEAREKVIDFSKPYYKSPSQLIAKESSEFRHPTPVGVLRGSADEAYALAKLKPLGFEVVAYGNQNEAFLDLGAGRLDAVLGPKVELQAGLLDTEQGRGLQFVGTTFSDTEFYGPGIGMAVKQGNQALLAQLNKSIDRIRADGTWRTITDSYLGYDL